MAISSALIIGAGQLGTRHLQAIVQSSVISDVYIIDPSEQAIKTAEQRFSEVTSVISGQVYFHRTMQDIPNRIDVAVIATAAKVRLQVLEKLLSKTKTRHLILEKVLFQQKDEYEKAGALIKRCVDSAWVNCPRRMFNFYSELKKRIDQNQHIHLSVIGSNWGLACNGIHFIDLAAYLSGNQEWKVHTGFISEVLPSKRSGYYEAAGTLILEGDDGSTVRLVSDSGTMQNALLTISGETFTAVIDESRGFARLCEADGVWKEYAFAVRYQSDMTGEVVELLSETGSCALTPFEESRRLHESFVAAMTNVFERFGIDGCPIT